MQTHKSWMRKEMKSEYDKTKLCKPISLQWEKEQRVNMANGTYLWSFENDTAWAMHYLSIDMLLYTLGHKLGTTKLEMENIFYITLFSC